MAMVPHERSLVKRLEGKPFALVGVNFDSSRETLKKCEEKNKTTWRSFFDGRRGPIGKEYNIKFLPTIYVLDSRGVIRYKGVRGEAMDKAVDRLLNESEGEKK
jgi:Thioredoxin-like